MLQSDTCQLVVNCLASSALESDEEQALDRFLYRPDLLTQPRHAVATIPGGRLCMAKHPSADV